MEYRKKYIESTSGFSKKLFWKTAAVVLFLFCVNLSLTVSAYTGNDEFNRLMQLSEKWESISPDTSIKYADSALSIAKSSNNQRLIALSLQRKSKALIQKNRHKQALKLLQLAKKINDSIYSDDNSKKIKELKTTFETEKKEKEIQLLERDNELKELEIKQKRNERNLVIIAIGLFIFSGFLLYYRYRIKNKANKLLEEKNLELQKTNKELTEINRKIHRQNQELEKLKEEQKQLIAMKDKFFSIIAHDLRNPFNAILGFSQLLIDSYDKFDENKKKEFLLKIKHASEETYRLLENLLEWAQSQSNQIEMQQTELNLLSVVNEVLSVLDSEIKIKNIGISVSVSEKTTVYADINMLKTILRNLITNAVKYSFEGGEIQILDKIKNDVVTICIADKGTGISPENRKKLFRTDEKFKAVGTANEKGTGLGLVLCKEFVEKNNGKIWVESEEGKGSTFCFTLLRK